MWPPIKLTLFNIIRSSLWVIILLVIHSQVTLAGDYIAPNWQDFSWEKVVEEKGIVVATAKFNHSKFTAVKSTMLVNARLNDVANLVLFVDGCHEKSTVCEKIENLKYIDQQNYSQYVVSKFPWPLKKRDMFLKISVHQEEKTGIVIVQGKSYQDEYLQAKEKNKRYIHIVDMDLQWRLIPQKEGMVLIEHYIHSDPGGIIPAWLFNDAVTSTPLATFENIKRLLSLAKYQQRNIPFISEPTLKQTSE